MAAVTNTIKRSVATLGVVAGLLAAAVPASAVTNGDQGNDTLAVKAPKLSDVNREGAWVPKIEIGALQETETVSARQPTITDIIMLKAPTNAGTQVGSEGVKDDVPLETVSLTFKGEVTGLEPT